MGKCGFFFFQNVSQLGIEPMPPAVEVWSPNHWTTREFPSVSTLVRMQKAFRFQYAWRHEEGNDGFDLGRDGNTCGPKAFTSLFPIKGRLKEVSLHPTELLLSPGRLGCSKK